MNAKLEINGMVERIQDAIGFDERDSELFDDDSAEMVASLLAVAAKVSAKAARLPSTNVVHKAIAMQLKTAFGDSLSKLFLLFGLIRYRDPNHN